MVEWRDRGFVQDSDDEEETIETQSTTRLETVGQLETQQNLAEREDADANGNYGLEEIVEEEAQLHELEVGISHEVEDIGETGRGKGLGARDVGEQGSQPGDEILADRKGHRFGGAVVLRDQELADDDIDELALSPIHQNRRRMQTPMFEPGENQDTVEDVWHLIGSSPLSEPPPTPNHAPLSPFGHHGDNSTHRREELTSSSTRQHVEVRIPRRESSVQIEGAPRSERQRNFRERKAIQLHPYQIDKIRYEKDMRSRGVKPVRIAMSSPQRKAHAENEQEEDDSQLSRNYQSSTAEEGSVSDGNRSTPMNSPPRRSSPISVSSPPRLPNSKEDEDLPELSELLKKRPFKDRTPQGGGKRRKVTHQYSRRHESSNAPTSTGADVPPDPTDDIFEVPDSPRTLSTIFPNQAGDGRLRIPPPISPLRRSTQAISSVKKTQSAARIISSVDGTPASMRRRKQAVTIQSPNRAPSELEDSSSSDSEDDPAEEIKAVKKRIKGVLPASWLKLDLKSREKNMKARPTSPRRIEYPQEDEATHRGVAKRTVRTGSRARSPPSPIPILSDNNFDDSDAENPLPNFGQLSDDDDLPLPLKSSSMPIHTLFDDDPGETMEDNSIDRMAPSTSRVRAVNGPGRKRQIKLKDAFNHSSKRLKTGAPSAYSAVSQSRTRRTEGQKQKRKRKASAPKLSVADALEDGSPNGPAVPQFLKIAAREARRRPDGGRQSPNNKHIRLQTRQDTQDTASVLRYWQTGKIQPRTTKACTRVPTRPPLGERNDNPRLEHVDGARGQPGVRPKLAVRRQETTRRVSRRPKEPWRLPSRSRPTHTAQLEMDEEEPSAPQDLSSFEIGLRNREFNLMFKSSAPSINSLVSRIGKLQWSDANNPQTPLKSTSHAATMQTPKAHTAPQRRLQRKRPTHRVDVDMSEYRQPEEFIPPSTYRSERLDTPTVDQAVLQDLSPFGVPYTKDFDILPLPIGTHFQQSTFIGSGDFKRALSIDRNLDTYNGNHVLYLEGKSHVWGQWNEDMASAVHDIFHSISTNMIDLNWTSGTTSNSELTNAAKVVQRLVKANADALSFSDPIDREACLSRFLECLQPMHTATIEYLEATVPEKESSNKAIIIHLATLQIALLQQLLSMCGSHSSESIRKQAIAHLQSLCVTSLRWLTRDGFEEIRTFFAQNSRHAVREAGIGEDEAAAAVESVVVMLHVLEAQRIPKYSFWDAFNAITLGSIPHTTRVGPLERAWYSMFTILPVVELDSSGVLNVGHRYTKSLENWSGVATIMSRVFVLYFSTSTIAGSTINDYVRSIFVRCWHLITDWSWRKCETIIGVIFDFFARNNLATLRNEVTHGSPHFLENLQSNPLIDIGPGDKSFHIFLKIVAIGLRGMHGMYPDKRIQSIAWRCIPNHGRIYRKDQEIKQEDLDALRNHHDLLCTLYWASPPGFRPRVDLIQNLVDHASSHREACRLNIKAWTNLARYQLSTGESLESEAPFAVWFNDVVEQTIDQFKLARTEAEAQFEAAKEDGETSVPQDLLDSTISRNQSHVLSSLAEAISGLRSVLTTTTTLEAASNLLRGSKVERVLTLFDPQNSRANSVIIECLLTHQAYLNRFSEGLNAETSRTTSEESQDYGDWPELEPEGEGVVAVSKKDVAPIDFIFEPVAQLLSNCFGAEKSPDDKLLYLVVDLWVSLAWLTVRRGQYGWESFLDEHGSHAWGQLRETEQRRKYGPYFLAKVSNLDPTTLDTYRSLFQSFWMSSLVERDAQLKFQHRLTNGILNHFPHDSLLRNLPFIQQPVNGAMGYDITLNELRDRRLGLLSSTLSNIHDLFHENIRQQTELRREYTPYLRQLMSSMRVNYTALQHHGKNMTGAYVIFVQRIVEFLQQYTSDICPVDKFFTDSVIFPLPAKDPLYVVGKLKGYTAKLGDAKEVRRLAGFFQSVSERAAVDNEQQYLVDQLQEALSGELKSGSLSLKAVLMQAIFPTYLESSFTTEVGWIVAKPVLIACATTFDHLLYDIRFDDVSSIDTALKIMESILVVLLRVIRDLVDRPERFLQAHALSIIAATLNVVTAALPSIDYINRRTGRGKAAIHSIGNFKSFSVFAAKSLTGVNGPFAPVLQGDEAAARSEHDEIKQFCARELHRDLANWKVEEGQYSVKRGTSWKEVAVSLESIEEEREGLMHSIEEFHTVLARMQFARHV